MKPYISVLTMPLFNKRAKDLLTEEERDEIVSYLASNPDKGDIVKDTGGVRKLRWARKGAGKRGGYRIIYYFHSESRPVFAITLYGKNEKENLTDEEKREMRKLTALLAK